MSEKSSYRVTKLTGLAKGQAAVEFALVIPLALVVLLVSVQLAIIGQAALSVSQASYAIARYVSVNPSHFTPNQSYNASDSTIQSLVAPTLKSNGGADLTVQVTACTSGSSCSAGAGSDSSPKFNDQLIVTVSYNASSKIILPNPLKIGSMTFATFPSTLSSSQSALYE